jgi:hypothetical protein
MGNLVNVHGLEQMVKHMVINMVVAEALIHFGITTIGLLQ